MSYYRRMPQFEYVAPKSVEEVCSFLQANQAETRVIAGGTITLHRMKERIGVKKYLLSLKAIPGLDGMSANGDGKLKIGPMATIQSVADSPIVRKQCTLLGLACSMHGTPQIRNMGTIGGNVACSLATAETMPVLTALGAEAKLTSAAGSRTVLIEDLYKELKDGEILTEILVPAGAGGKSGYEKWAMRKKFDYATISAAVVMTLTGGKTCNEARLGLGGVTLPTRRAKRAEDMLKGQSVTDALIEQVAQTAAEDARVGADVNFTGDYKKELVKVMVRRAIKKALA
jgi:aerobic carbon-monoxide dehydrogenase medium subunit